MLNTPNAAKALSLINDLAGSSIVAVTHGAAGYVWALARLQETDYQQTGRTLLRIESLPQARAVASALYNRNQGRRPQSDCPVAEAAEMARTWLANPGRSDDWRATQVRLLVIDLGLGSPAEFTEAPTGDGWAAGSLQACEGHGDNDEAATCEICGRCGHETAIRSGNRYGVLCLACYNERQDAALADQMEADHQVASLTPTDGQQATQEAPQASPIKMESLGLACDLDLRPGDRVTLRTPAWALRPEPEGKGLASRILEGEVTAVTRRGMEFQGHASVKEAEHCHRCGKAITHPASLRVGYGPVCSGHLGIEWGTGDLTEEEIEAIRARIVRETTVQHLWLPRGSTAVLAQERPAKIEPQRPSATERLGALVARKTGIEASGAEHGQAIGRTLRWIARNYGIWDELPEEMQEEVLRVLAEMAPRRPPQMGAGREVNVQDPAHREPQAKAWVDGDLIYVQSQYSQDNVAKSRQACNGLGRWTPSVKAWRYPATAVSAHSLRQVWGEEIEGDDAFQTLSSPEALAAYRERIKGNAWQQIPQGTRMGRQQEDGLLDLDSI